MSASVALSTSVPVCFGISICPRSSLSVSFCRVCPSERHPVRWSVCLSVRLSVRPPVPVCLSWTPCVCLSAILSVCLFIYTSLPVDLVLKCKSSFQGSCSSVYQPVSLSWPQILPTVLTRINSPSLLNTLPQLTASSKVSSLKQTPRLIAD